MDCGCGVAREGLPRAGEGCRLWVSPYLPKENVLHPTVYISHCSTETRSPCPRPLKQGRDFPHHWNMLGGKGCSFRDEGIKGKSNPVLIPLREAGLYALHSVAPLERH